MASVVAATTACAPLQRDAYERAHPRWAAFPTLGSGVRATLAGLFDEGAENARVSLREMALFRTDSDPWQEISLEALPPPGGLTHGDYALAARRFCRTWADEPIVVGANEWYLFRDGRLQFYDARSYGGACAFAPAIEPARGASIPREEQLRAWIATSFPGEDAPAVVHYARGIAYADAGRRAAAEEFLASGDAAPPAPRGIRVNAMRIGRSVAAGGEQLPQEFDADSARVILVRQIEALRASGD